MTYAVLFQPSGNVDVEITAVESKGVSLRMQWYLEAHLIVVISGLERPRDCGWQLARIAPARQDWFVFIHFAQPIANVKLLKAAVRGCIDVVLRVMVSLCCLLNLPKPPAPPRWPT